MFDPETRGLNFPDGRAIRVTKELIHDVLGFSVTSSPINLDRMRNNANDIYEEFRSYWEVKKNDRLIVNVIHDWMIDQIEGDRKYKLYFMVLVTTLLMETSEDGSVNENILLFVDYSKDVVKYWDWRGFILDAMIRTTTGFNPANNFNRPLLVMVLIYVNSTTIIEENAIRLRPGMINWTSDL